MLIEQAREKGLNFAHKRYQGNNPDALRGPTEFWVNSKKQGPVLHTSVNAPPHPAKGSSKSLYAKDSSLVALIPRTSDQDFSQEAMRDNSDLAALNLSTVKYGVVVDESQRLMIAHNAGELLKGRLIPCEHFRNAVNDLAALHQAGIYLRDIKPANMAYDGKRHQVNFIDVEDRINQGQQEEIKNRCTPLYITHGLVVSLYGGSGKQDYSAFRTADEYAFLLTMLLHTYSGNSLADNFIQSAVTSPDFIFHKHLGQSYPCSGVMNQRNRSYFMVWIEQYIKPEHRKNVEMLLDSTVMKYQARGQYSGFEQWQETRRHFSHNVSQDPASA